MTTHRFKRRTPDSLITTQCWIGLDRFTLALDTGASHTLIDLTPLLMAGYEMKDARGAFQFETGKGVIDALEFELKSFTVFGITRKEMTVYAYDFLANQVLSEFDGVLGLDFFQQETICIDFDLSEISVRSKGSQLYG